MLFRSANNTTAKSDNWVEVKISNGTTFIYNSTGKFYKNASGNFAVDAKSYQFLKQADGSYTLNYTENNPTSLISAANGWTILSSNVDVYADNTFTTVFYSASGSGSGSGSPPGTGTDPGTGDNNTPPTQGGENMFTSLTTAGITSEATKWATQFDGLMLVVVGVGIGFAAVRFVKSLFY